MDLRLSRKTFLRDLKMTFRKWLKENYGYSGCAIGDLYEVMNREDILRRKYPEKYPKYALWKNNRDWIIEHLKSLGAGKETIRSLKKAWKEYESDIEMGFA